MNKPRTTFPLSPEDAKASVPLREAFQRFWADTSEPPRAHYDRFIADTPMADGVSFREVIDADGPGWWCEPAQPSGKESAGKRAILYVHGGGYVMGSATAYRGFASQIAARTKTPVFALDYPLAPEARLPVALEMVGKVIEKLRRKHEVIGLAGDSAGGGLSLASLARYPGAFRAAAVFSPWADLGLSGVSITDAASRDVLLAADYLREASQSYRGEVSPDDPRASPLFSIPANLPPLLLQVGTDEILYDDSLRYAAAATAAGAPVELEVWEGMHHVFQLNVKELQAARTALDRAGDFLATHLR